MNAVIWSLRNVHPIKDSLRESLAQNMKAASQQLKFSKLNMLERVGAKFQKSRFLKKCSEMDQSLLNSKQTNCFRRTIAESCQKMESQNKL